MTIKRMEGRSFKFFIDEFNVAANTKSMTQ